MTAANLYKNQSANIRRTWLLMSVFFVLIIFLGWFASYHFGDPAILYIAVFFSIFMNIFSYWFSDKIVLRISGAKPATKKEYYNLYTITENLCITAGLPLPKLYVINDTVPNAFATGRDKNHAAVAVTTGLLAILDKNELEGVIAHELAHIGNRDILLQTVVVVLVGLVTLLADLFLRAQIYGRGDHDNKGSVILLIIGAALMLLSPLFATLIQLAISRKREFLADATGAMLTRYPDGLASALKKISANGAGRKMKNANHATAHLFIASPFGDSRSKSVGFWTKIFSTHPPVEERVAALLSSPY